MSKYTLYTYCDTKILEKYDKRSTNHIREILLAENNQRPNDTDFFGKPIESANRFEIRNNKKYVLFTGNVVQTLSFLKTLK